MLNMLSFQARLILMTLISLVLFAVLCGLASRTQQSTEEIDDMSAQIASAAEEQSAVSEEISRSITAINDLTEETTDGALQTT